MEGRGEVLLIQGRGTRSDAASSAERVVHDALAMVAWDAARARYVMSTYRAGQGAGAPEIQVTDGTIVWSLDNPRGKVRFTIQLDKQGRWVERGEYSADGQAWHEFFGMTLTRTAEATPGR